MCMRFFSIHQHVFPKFANDVLITLMPMQICDAARLVLSCFHCALFTLICGLILFFRLCFKSRYRYEGVCVCVCLAIAAAVKANSRRRRGKMLKGGKMQKGKPLTPHACPPASLSFLHPHWLDSAHSQSLRAARYRSLPHFASIFPPTLTSPTSPTSPTPTPSNPVLSLTRFFSTFSMNASPALYDERTRGPEAQ
ncbi:hypothetical protein IWX49DRAFT_436413 [Phyllosticta citricarpa]